MKTTRTGTFGLALGVSLLTCSLGAQSAAAQTATGCAPACAAGETCVSGVCMVPARPPAAPLPAPAAEAPVAPEPPAPAPQAIDAETPRARPTPTAPPASWNKQPPTAYAPGPALPDRERTGTLFLPYVGLHSFQDSNDQGLDPGLRIGALLGGYINEIWSINAGAEFDVMNFNDKVSSAGLDASAQMLDLTFSPLIHVGNVKAEFVFGPKLGFWMEWVHLGDGTTSADGTGEGWLVGANTGVFVAASRSALVGALVSLELRDIIHHCASGTGVPEMCGGSSNSSSATILGFSFGVML